MKRSDLLMSSKVGVILFFVLIPCLFQGTGCGEMSLDGKKRAQEILLTPTEPRLREEVTPEGIRIFKGEITEPLTIKEGDQVIFASESEAPGLKQPVFNGAFTVEAGAHLQGGAQFNSSLVLKGTKEKPITWAMNQEQAAKAGDVKWDWVVFSGETTLLLQLNKDAFSLIKNTRFLSTRLSFVPVQESQLRVSRSEFVDSHLLLSSDGDGVAGTTAQEPRFTVDHSKFTRSIVHTVSEPKSLSVRMFANNFGEVNKEALTQSPIPYFGGYGLGQCEPNMTSIVSENFFAVLSGIRNYCSTMALGMTYIQDPFPSGPGSEDDLIFLNGAGGQGARVTINSAFPNWMQGADPKDFFLGSWAYSIVENFIFNSNKKYVFDPKSHEDVNLKLFVGDVQGCVEHATELTQSVWLECGANAFTIDYELSVLSGDEKLTSFSFRETFLTLKSSSFYPKFKVPVDILLREMITEGYLAEIPIHTPYY